MKKICDGFWEVLMKISFWILNNWYTDELPDPEENARYWANEEAEYMKWLQQEGYSSKEEMWLQQQELLDDDTHEKTANHSIRTA